MDNDVESLIQELKKLFPAIIELLRKASEIVKEICYYLRQQKPNQDFGEGLTNVLELALSSASTKEMFENFVHLALEKLGQHLSSNTANNDDTGLYNANVSSGTNESNEDVEYVISNIKNGKDGSENRVYTEDSLSNQLNQSNIEDKQDQTPLEMIKNKRFDKERQMLENFHKGKLTYPDILKSLKIGNLTDEEQNKRLTYIVDYLKRQSDKGVTITNDQKCFRDKEACTSVNFGISDQDTQRESGMYIRYNAIFHNNCRHRFDENGDILMIPDDIERSQETLQELKGLLSMSNKNSFDVQIPDYVLPTKGEHEWFYLIADIIIDQPSRKTIKRRFVLRMHVVSPEAFENAMRDCYVHSLELTYTNIFPSNCRMFISLPIYRDSYLDRKERLIRS